MAALVSCCLSAAGLRFLGILSRPGLPPLLRSAYRAAGDADPSGVFMFRTRETRPGRAPSVPGDGGARTATCASRGRRLPPYSGRSLSPRYHDPIPGCFLTRHQQGFTGIRPSRPFPSPVTPGRNEGPWAFPRASHPAGQDPAAHARAGTSLRHWPGITPPPSANCG